MKVLYIVNSSIFFCSHFMVLAENMLLRGHEVYVVAGDDIKKNDLEMKGFHFTSIQLSRDGRNPLREMHTIISLYKVIRLIKPDIMHMFTIKPIIYGALINKLFAKVRVPLTVASITGLGSASLATSLQGKSLWFLIKTVYKIVLSLPSTKVIFENKDDKALFVKLGLVPELRTFLVNGAGVDTSLFCPPNSRTTSPLIVVLVARLLKDKGIREYIGAGKLLKERGVNVCLQLVGSIDSGNISSMTQEDIDWAHSHGYIEYLGQRSDVAQIYQKGNVACLPSYREGLPKSLIEASACGLAIVTTDVPGCRQMVFDGQNGVLVKAKCVNTLANAIERLAEQPNLVVAMGQKSREKAVSIFDHSSIVDSFLNIYSLNKD